jgi:Ca2+-binding EF-hand superfamily protein
VKEKIKPGVLKKLASGNHDNYLKKEIFIILSTYFRSEVIEKWNKCFNSLDVEGTGKIKISKIIEMLQESNISPARIEKIEGLYSKDKDATISYSDFLTKVINFRKEISEDDVKKAFEQLDVDGSGKIGENDINSLLQRRGHDHLQAQTLLHEVDFKKQQKRGGT